MEEGEALNEARVRIFNRRPGTGEGTGRHDAGRHDDGRHDRLDAVSQVRRFSATLSLPLQTAWRISLLSSSKRESGPRTRRGFTWGLLVPSFVTNC